MQKFLADEPVAHVLERVDRAELLAARAVPSVRFRARVEPKASRGRYSSGVRTLALERRAAVYALPLDQENVRGALGNGVHRRAARERGAGDERPPGAGEQPE